MSWVPEIADDIQVRVTRNGGHVRVARQGLTAQRFKRPTATFRCVCASMACGVSWSLGYRSPNIAPYRRVLVAMVHPAMWGASTVTVPAVRVAALAASVTRA